MSDIVEQLYEAAKEEYYARYGGYDVIMIKAAAEIKRLRAAGNAAFYAMCAQRDNPDNEVFQDAIDALRMALSGSE